MANMLEGGQNYLEQVLRHQQSNKHADALSKSPLPLASNNTSLRPPCDVNVAAIQSHDKESVKFVPLCLCPGTRGHSQP